MYEAGSGPEKRKSPRVETTIPVRYKVLRDGTESVGAGCASCNLSADGLRFTTNEFLPTACHLILEFDIPDAVAQPIKAMSKVAWVKADDDARYHVGSRFMEITEREREVISQFIGSC